MVGLAGIAQRGRGHGDLEAAEHVIEALDPHEALRLILVHGKVERDAEEHLLGALERRMVVRMDHIAMDEQVEPRIGEQLVTIRGHEGGGLVELGRRIGGEDVIAVQTALG